MYERLTQIFAQLGVDYEIIFVNDCSPANDEAVIRQLCDRIPMSSAFPIRGILAHKVPF
jgi:Glycosyl transferase family 2.